LHYIAGWGRIVAQYDCHGKEANPQPSSPIQTAISQRADVPMALETKW